MSLLTTFLSPGVCTTKNNKVYKQLKESESESEKWVESERRAISHNKSRIRLVLKERKADYSTLRSVLLVEYEQSA